MALWFYRLYFDGGTGAVIRKGKHQALDAPPEIPGLGPVSGIDYIPCVCASIQRAHEGWHEMDSQEARCCFEFLRSDPVVH